MNIREILLKLRADNNLSQQEFSEMLNVSRQTVSRWEAGKSVPSSSQISNICRVFGLDANELLSNSQEKQIDGLADADNADEHAQAQGQTKKSVNKINIAVLTAVGVFLALALAGLIITIVYAVKDGVYDSSATVWIMAIPANTPMIILCVFLALFIIALVVLLVYLLRRKGK